MTPKAKTLYSVESYKATITLAKDWKIECVTDNELNSTALHEMIHLFLAELSSLAEEHYSTSFVEKVEHNAINRLIKTLL